MWGYDINKESLVCKQEGKKLTLNFYRSWKIAWFMEESKKDSNNVQWSSVECWQIKIYNGFGKLNLSRSHSRYQLNVYNEEDKFCENSRGFDEGNRKNSVCSETPAM